MPGRRALLAAALLLPAVARAQPAPAALPAIRAAVGGHVLPRHAAFAAAARDFATATEAVRETPAEAAAEAARAAWIRAALAFQGIRHLRFGPLEALDLGYRLFFFPDPRNITGREMAGLLRAADPAAITPEAFARGRIAAQGLPAAERLLFGAEQGRLLAPGQGFRRDLLAAIGRNVADIAAALDGAWRGGNPPHAAQIEGMPGGIHRDAQDGLLALFKSLHGGLEFTAEREVARPLGPSLREAFPRRAEAWRSGQSLALVQAAIAAQAELWQAGFRALTAAQDAELARKVDAAFAAAAQAAARVAPGLEAAVAAPQGRPAVEALLQALGAVRRLLSDRVAPAIGVPVGFNATDGD
jgi:hypothetical protein